MALSPKIKKYLDEQKVAYEALEHPLAYTAQEVAGSGHIPGKELLKAIIVKPKGKKEYMMCILSSIELIDFDKLESVTGKKDLELADEAEISTLFPDYEIGAEPPFGHLYNLPTYADKAIEKTQEIVFNGGTHTDVIKMKTNDFLRLAKPTMADFGRHI